VKPLVVTLNMEWTGEEAQRVTATITTTTTTTVAERGK
jgi:hypothetical protein